MVRGQIQGSDPLVTEKWVGVIKRHGENSCIFLLVGFRVLSVYKTLALP